MNEKIRAFDLFFYIYFKIFSIVMLDRSSSLYHVSCSHTISNILLFHDLFEESVYFCYTNHHIVRLYLYFFTMNVIKIFLYAVQCKALHQTLRTSSSQFGLVPSHHTVAVGALVGHILQKKRKITKIAVSCSLKM